MSMMTYVTNTSYPGVEISSQLTPLIEKLAQADIHDMSKVVAFEVYVESPSVVCISFQVRNGSEFNLEVASCEISYLELRAILAFSEAAGANKFL